MLQHNPSSPASSGIVRQLGVWGLHEEIQAFLHSLTQQLAFTGTVAHSRLADTLAKWAFLDNSVAEVSLPNQALTANLLHMPKKQGSSVMLLDWLNNWFLEVTAEGWLSF